MLGNMELTVYNTLQDIGTLLPDAPAPRYLRGYLRQVDDSARRLPDADTAVPLPADLQEDFRHHAELAAQYVAILPKHFPDYRPDGGFTSSHAYWGRAFLTDRHWRAALWEMDGLADLARYLPQ